MFLIVFAPSSSRLSRVVPPCATVQAGHRLQARHKIRCRRDPDCGKTRTQYPVSVSIIHLFKSTLQVLYIYIRCMSSEYLRVLQTSWRGWAVSTAVHSMECRGGAHALLEGYLSVGAAACDALYCQRWEVYYLKLVLTLKEPNNRLTPGPYAWVVFITGDTLRHQPMGAGHMTVFQFRGPITYCVLQWCHPMLTGT